MQCLWRWLGSERTFPSFEFRPTSAFHESMGDDAQYEVTNPVDLLLQCRGLMSPVLMVDVRSSAGTLPLCMLYDPERLSSHGSAACTLYHGAVLEIMTEGTLNRAVCGHVCDVKRI